MTTQMQNECQEMTVEAFRAKALLYAEQMYSSESRIFMYYAAGKLDKDNFLNEIERNYDIFPSTLNFLRCAMVKEVEYWNFANADISKEGMCVLNALNQYTRNFVEFANKYGYVDM